MQFVIPYNVPSQNVRDHWHWSKRHADTKQCENMIRVKAQNVPRATETRLVYVTAYRKTRCSDIANLIGGAKGIIDALVRVGLLVDDKDAKASIFYEQFPLSQMPPDVADQSNGRPCTVIRLEDVLCQ